MAETKFNSDKKDIQEESGELSIRPYARLITMIGEQLIRNEKIALLELIKNSYDADAKQVEINFINFGNKDGQLEVRADSVIELKDDGDGMTLDIIKDAWMNPASPNKYLKKIAGKARTKNGRIIQGEKGIGRFAIFKIGHIVELFTRSITKPSKEIYVKCDLSLYDDELLSKKGEKIEAQNKLFIDDIKYTFTTNDIGKEQEQRWKINNKSINNGVVLRISNIKSIWDEGKIHEIFNDCLKLISPFNKTEFAYSLYLNGKLVGSSSEKNRLDALLNDADLHMKGTINKAGDCAYELSRINGEFATKGVLKLSDLASDSDVKDRFYDKVGKKIRDPKSGPFLFEFYVFDIKKADSIGSPLSKEDIKLIRENRIYLYRDGVRVNPYGAPDDDWIQLDVKRGTVKAGAYLSNDQVTGYIAITSKDNPDLRDKANREGLMDVGNSYNDLTTLVLGVLGFLNSEFKKNQIQIKSKSNTRLIKESVTENDLKRVQALLEKKGDTESKEVLNTAISEYKKEKKILVQRAEIIEDLAGVGLTVDAASHDLMMMLNRAEETLNALFEITKKRDLNVHELQETLEKLRGQFGFIEDQMHGIQPLFRSTRRKRNNLRIKDIIERVQIYYTDPIARSKIKFEVKEINPPLVVKCSEAVLLQVFINLLDNAVYWLTTQDEQQKTISIVIDGPKSEVVFADNGPGVRKGDEAYIFEPFFSTKGIHGRGLGLYIARQLLERNDFEISYIEQKNKQLLSGANFLVVFSDNIERE